MADPEYQLLAEVLGTARKRLGFALCGYVLMPDHWHALLWPARSLTISRVLHDIKKISALRFNRRRNTSGPIWHHQFWDRFVRHPKEFSDRLEYMHFNPVRRGLVSVPGEWRWSSHNNFAGDAQAIARCPIAIDFVRLPMDYRA